MNYTTDDIYELLEQVKDPEVPVLSIVDLGIVRNVAIHEKGVEISITPTYSGCPAMRTIEEDITKMCRKNNIVLSEIKTILSPAWTTDWLSESGKLKLKEYGIAPPVNEPDKSVLFGKKPKIQCPKCASFETKILSEFGSTSCKALYQCKDCLEPFEYFKCLK
jgi:ring-1,2-phenylacetyl-CoA epoxidase subunit PaaD